MFTLDMPESRSFYIRTDEVRLKQVRFSLKFRAVKFIDAGGKVSVRVREDSTREVAARSVILEFAIG
jgi:signal transduction histidine kinase